MQKTCRPIERHARTAENACRSIERPAFSASRKHTHNESCYAVSGGFRPELHVIPSSSPSCSIYNNMYQLKMHIILYIERHAFCVPLI